MRRKLSKDEARALAFVLGLIGLSVAVRVVGRPAPLLSPEAAAAPSSATAPAAEVDVAALERKSKKLLAKQTEADRPLGAGEQVDVNHARPVELERLPGVGPALAARIVAYRDSAGLFRALGDLDSVPGIGPATLKRLTPLVKLRP